MANTVLDLINRHHPTHMAAAFDTSEPTQRHIDFPEYKAQRDALPEDIGEQLPLIQRLLEGFHIPVIRMPGYEADDIIGTLARQAEQQGFETWDGHSRQGLPPMVTDRIVVYKPGRKGGEHELLGVNEILDHWQNERIDQVIDILALMGDSSDNIPGVPGVGPKTAQKLIAKFGTVENLLKNTDQLKGKQRRKSNRMPTWRCSRNGCDHSVRRAT